MLFFFFCLLTRELIFCLFVCMVWAWVLGMVQEVEEVGGKEELEKEINRRIKLYNKGSTS